MELKDIKIYVINLEKRKDRLEEVSQMLNGYNWERVEAIETKNGYYGCVLSHIKCIKKAMKEGLPEVIVMEDDHELKFPENFTYPEGKWDVCLLTGKSIKGQNINDKFMKISSARHTDCYMVKGSYFPNMLRCFNNSLLELLNEYKHPNYLDVYWDKYMGKDNFLCLRNLIGGQRNGFSDIEGGNRNRGNEIKMNF
jgi:hypothetical protein